MATHETTAAHERYVRLVEEVKAHKFVEGLVNPFDIGGKNLFRDQNQINPWSVWQHNLNAKILVIGQDWGSEEYFEKNHGQDNDANPTNITLQNLLSSVGYDPGLFSKPNPQPLFFTNAVLGIREGKAMSGPVRMKWVTDSRPFIQELLGIIRPRIIVTLGAIPLAAVRMIFEDKVRNGKLRELAPGSPYPLNENQWLFAMYHCGPLGLANLARDSRKNGKAAMQDAWDQLKTYC